MNNLITLTTKASSQNAYHEWIYTYTDGTTATKCRMVPVKVADRMIAPGIYDDVVYTCYTLSSAAITRNSQVKYGSNYYMVKESELDSEFFTRKSLLVEVP